MNENEISLLARVQLLEREIHKLKQTEADLRRYCTRPEDSLILAHPRFWLGLDEYELVNLREALRAVAGGDSPLHALNSGDWVMQILRRLDTVRPEIMPNCSAERYRELAKGPR